MPLPPDIIKRLSDLASRLDEMGFHSLSDDLDVCMSRTAAGGDPFRQRRMEYLSSDFEMQHRDLILRAVALEELLGSDDLPRRAIERWMEILSDPENSKVLRTWLETGRVGDLGGPQSIKDPQEISNRAVRMPGSWAIEDSIMKDLSRVLGENLKRHSFLDRKRRYRMGEPDPSSTDPLHRVDADFRGETTGNLYELKEARGPLHILHRALPHPKYGGVDDGFEFLISNLRNLNAFHHSIDTRRPVFPEVDVSMHRIPARDVRALWRRQDRPSNISLPDDAGEMSRARMDPFEVGDALEEYHGSPGDRNPPWRANLKTLMDQLS